MGGGGGGGAQGRRYGEGKREIKVVLNFGGRERD